MEKHPSCLNPCNNSTQKSGDTEANKWDRPPAPPTSKSSCVEEEEGVGGEGQRVSSEISAVEVEACRNQGGMQSGSRSVTAQSCQEVLLPSGTTESSRPHLALGPPACHPCRLLSCGQIHPESPSHLFPLRFCSQHGHLAEFRSEPGPGPLQTQSLHPLVLYPSPVLGHFRHPR